MKVRLANIALGAAFSVLVAACGGGGDVATGPAISLTPQRGDIVANPPPMLTSFSTPAEFTAALNATATGRNLLALAGTPKCGINFHYMTYYTVGGAAEQTKATGGVMVPTGSDPACTGPRPVLLYGHGTTVEKGYNIASPANGEAGLLAAFYAAQGWIVVAPNYAGYDASDLPYHPYLNAEQQANDMIDALRAARKAFPNIGANASNKLFISGYSQGGHVAMATHKAMQALPSEFSVTASGPMSGPYSLTKFSQTVFAGGVNAGATIFFPMLMTSYQRSYGNIYASVNDVYEPAYATGIETLIPSATLTTTTLVTTGRLPTRLWANNPLVTGDPSLDALFAAGVGTPNLVKTSFRQAVLANPSHPVWAAAARNDLTTGWTPTRPMAMCFGAQDPVVFGSNTAEAAAAFRGRGAPAALINVFNLEDATTVGPTLAAGFAAAKAATASDPAAPGASPAEKVLQAYHGSLVPPFCNVAVRTFFQQVLASGQ